LTNETLDTKAQSYCFNNGIEIYPIPTSRRRIYRIGIKTKQMKESKVSPVTYDETATWAKIWELYKYYYNKSQNKVKPLN